MKLALLGIPVVLGAVFAAAPQEKSRTGTTLSKIGNVTSVVEDVPPVPPKCRVTVATSPKISDEANFMWFYFPMDGVEVESEEPNKIVVLVPVAGERDYHFMWSAREPKGKQKTERVTVKAGKGPRPPPDPGPGPTPEPEPPGPAPTPAPIDHQGNHVLIVYETADQSAYTGGQINFMYSAEVRSYLTEKCPKVGNSNGWYMLDKDAVVNALPEYWRKAMARPRSKLPWMIVSNGKTGWEGPIPDRYEDAFAKVKDFIK